MLTERWSLQPKTKGDSGVINHSKKVKFLLAKFRPLWAAPPGCAGSSTGPTGTPRKGGLGERERLLKDPRRTEGMREQEEGKVKAPLQKST